MIRSPFHLRHIIKKSQKLSSSHHSERIMLSLNSKKSDFIDIESNVFHASTSPHLECIEITLMTTETSEPNPNFSARATIWIPSITIATQKKALIEVEKMTQPGLIPSCSITTNSLIPSSTNPC